MPDTHFPNFFAGKGSHIFLGSSPDQTTKDWFR